MVKLPIKVKIIPTPDRRWVIIKQLLRLLSQNNGVPASSAFLLAGKGSYIFAVTLKIFPNIEKTESIFAGCFSQPILSIIFNLIFVGVRMCDPFL